jgi:hypothetical protein
MAGRTTILISHDLLTVAEADQILYLERGRIVEAGSHDELLGAGNGYAHLYQLRHRVSAPPNGRTARHRAPGPDGVWPGPPWGEGPWGPPPWDDAAPARRDVPVGEPDEPWDGPPPSPARHHLVPPHGGRP